MNQQRSGAPIAKFALEAVSSAAESKNWWQTFYKANILNFFTHHGL